MKSTTHLTAGAVTGLLIAQGAQPSVALLTCGITAICGLLPDIDTGASGIAKLCRPAAYTLQLFFGHRGLFHSPVLWAILCAAWYCVAPQHSTWIKAAACGILSHLMLDTLNPAGVPWLWPFKIRIAIPAARSGGILDRLLGLMLTVLFFIMLTAIVFPM